jgi:hypothetical protein
MQSDFDILERFKFGLNLDDPWRYTGMKEPKSIIIPHLLKVELKENDTAGKLGEAIARALGRRISNAEEEIIALANAASDAEIDFVRCWFPWNYFVGKVGDEHSFPMDNMVNALKEKGIAVIPVVACGYSRMLPEGINIDKEPSNYIEKAAEHARELVNHYKNSIRVWQIENEPNWWEMHEAAGWRKGAAWLEGKFRYELLKMLNDAVHDEDSNAMTLINIEADRGVDEARMYSSLSDAIGFDFYPNYQEADPVDARVITKAEEIAENIGKNVIISETGYPSGPSWLGYSYTKQAQYIMRACLQAFECRHVSAISIWRYADTSWRSFPPQENHFGLFDEYLNAKPAYKVFADTIRQLKKDSQLSH